MSLNVSSKVKTRFIIIPRDQAFKYASKISRHVFFIMEIFSEFKQKTMAYEVMLKATRRGMQNGNCSVEKLHFQHKIFFFNMCGHHFARSFAKAILCVSVFRHERANKFKNIWG